MKAVPASLVKKGIFGVRDNLEPGDELAVSKAFVRLFRMELEDRLIHKGIHHAKNTKTAARVAIVSSIGSGRTESKFSD